MNQFKGLNDYCPPLRFPQLLNSGVETPVHPGVQQLREEMEQERYKEARARLIREILNAGISRWK